MEPRTKRPNNVLKNFRIVDQIAIFRQEADPNGQNPKNVLGKK